MSAALTRWGPRELVSRAKTAKALALLFALLALLLAGCAVGVGATTQEVGAAYREDELDKLLGATTDQVRQSLGEPRAEFVLSDKSYFVYETHQDVAGIAFVGGLPLPMPEDSAQRRCALLVFGSDQRLSRFETSGSAIMIELAAPGALDRRQCKNVFFSWEDFAEFEAYRGEQIKARVEAGDPKAVYEYAEWQWRQAETRSLDPLARKSLICRSAHGGYPPAQRRMAIYHLYPEEPDAGDPVRAYMWLTLADGEDARSVSAIARKMTPGQLAEAKRLATAWQPNPAECETVAASVQVTE